MNEEMIQAIHRMQQVAEHTFARAEKELMSGKELSLSELGALIDIAMDSSKLMKYTVEMKKYYEYHSDKML